MPLFGTIVISLISLFILKSETLEISHTDLESPHKICGVSSTCDNRITTSSKRTESFEIWNSRNCQCDEECARYGDCCVDSPLYDTGTHRRAVSSFQCNSFGSHDVYVKKRCPPSWKDANIRRLCELSSDPETDDPLLRTPVTSLNNNNNNNNTNNNKSNNGSITYGNVYCARCNGDDVNNAQYWQMGLVCDGYDSSRTTVDTERVDDIVYDTDKRSWRIRVDGRDNYNCSNVRPVVPIPLENGRYVRTCLRDMIQTCPSDWTISNIRDHCEAYTSVFYTGGTNNINNKNNNTNNKNNNTNNKNNNTNNNNNDAVKPYRNVHCGICNRVPVQRLKCTDDRRSGIDVRLPAFDTTPSFTVLFDFHGGRTVGKTSPCRRTDGGQIYDPFFRKCRDVFNFDDNKKNHRNYDDHNNNNNLKRNNCHPLSVDEYVRYNDTVYVPEYNKTYGPADYYILNDSDLTVCILIEYNNNDNNNNDNLVSKYKPYFGVLTFIGIGVSILCLIAHLTVFCLVDDLRNLSGMNLASYCVALLIGYVSFLFGDFIYDNNNNKNYNNNNNYTNNIINNNDKVVCLLNAMTTYYFFLAAFFWLMTIAFDVWRALKTATSELRIANGKQWKKFLIYSCWSWLTPATIVLTSIIVETSFIGIHVPERLRPNFGTYSCWFGNGPSLLLFVGLPLSVIMLTNLAFFIGSSRMIYSSRSMTVYSAGTDTLKNFKLFSRLALISGLTWITGLIGGALDTEFVWVIFIISNTLQGLFVFVGFTWRRRVLKALKNRIRFARNDNSPRLPNYSVSVTSSDTELTKVRKSSGNVIGISVATTGRY